MKIADLTKFFTGESDGQSLCLSFDRSTFKGRQGDDIEYARLLFLSKRPGRSISAQNVKVQQDLIPDVQSQFDTTQSDELPGIFTARVDVEVVNDNARVVYLARNESASRRLAKAVGSRE